MVDYRGSVTDEWRRIGNRRDLDAEETRSETLLNRAYAMRLLKILLR